jgi:NhaP-type Na+/H+ or K+/H+ antiporter
VHEGVDAILATFVIAVSLGIGAQVVAHRFKLPAILPLLVFGMGVGPYALDFLHPASLGHGLEVIVHLGVAVILFEGGLSLDLRQLRRVGTSVTNLLTIGTLVTAVGAAWLAQACLGLSWNTAALFGAIVTVTGPTVISPLLRHMIAPRRVRTVLLSEGLMIDPIGAVLAYLVLQWIGRTDLGLKPLGIELIVLFATGAILGFVAGRLAVFVVRHRHLNDELRNLTTLALLFATFLVAEAQAPQSGILASVVMGITVTGAHTPDLNPLKAFKGQLTVLVISVLFILLSAQLDLGAMRDLGWNGLLVVGGLILLVRPLAVLLSIPPKEASWKERLLLAMTAPRGIVAAAVASLSALQLRGVGNEAEALTLEGLVYLVIIVTCTWATLAAKLLPRWLGYVGDPSRRRAVLVGANPLSEALAAELLKEGWMAVVVDGAPSKVAAFRRKRITAVQGDAREVGTFEEAGVERDTHVLALTPNDELNLLVAQLVRDEFSIEHPVVGLQHLSGDFDQRRGNWVDLLGGTEAALPDWYRRLEGRQAQLVTVDLKNGPLNHRALRTVLREHKDRLRLLCGWADGRPDFRCPLDELNRWQRFTLLMLDEKIREELAAGGEFFGPKGGEGD